MSERSLVRQFGSISVAMFFVISYMAILAPLISAAPPYTPAMMSPASDSTVNSSYPVFSWNASSDPDNDQVYYHLVVSMMQSLAEPVMDVYGITDTSYASSTFLSDGTYYWSVEAYDNENGVTSFSGFPSIWAFTVSTSSSQNDMGTGVDANDSIGSAILISPASGNGYLGGSDYEDFYKVNVNSGQTISVSVTPPSGMDVSLYLYDPSQYSVASSSNPGDSPENLTYTAASTGDYYIEVLYVYSTPGTYSMTVDVSSGSPPSSSTTLTIEPSSFTVGSGQYYTLSATLKDSSGYTISGKPITMNTSHGTLSTSSSTTDTYGQVWFTFNAPTVSTQTYVTINAYFDGDNSYSGSSTSSYGTVTTDNTQSDNNYYDNNYYPPYQENKAVNFAPPHNDSGVDIDGDGAFDQLTINFNLSVQTAGTYNLNANLYDSAGYTWIDFKSKEVTLSAGSQTVSLSFDGSAINKSKLSGPYTVYVNVNDQNWYWIAGDSHTTQTYSYSSFQASSLSLEPPHTDSPLDNDGDGIYDYLVVNVNVNVGKAGKYYLNGSLNGPSTTYTYDNQTYTQSYGTFVAWAWRDLTLSAGKQKISLYFDGQMIKKSQVNGPYTVSISINNETYTVFDWGEHTTGTYTYSQFGRAVTSFAPPHSDSGVDEDGDGLYDYLDVTVNLNVATAGKYNINGSMMSGAGYTTYATTTTGTTDNYNTVTGTTDYSTTSLGSFTRSSFIAHAWKDAELSAGKQSIVLRFQGSEIRKSKLSGPYTVEISLNKDWEWLDSVTYTTQTYAYTDFQAAAIDLAPPHSDSGVDEDGDGLYDYLVVDVNLKVSRAGTYSLNGSLMVGTWDYDPMATNTGGTSAPTPPTFITHAWKEVELATGSQTVQLRFDGERIRQSGLDGPYTAELNVFGPHKVEDDFYAWNWGSPEYGRHTTGSYAYTQFEQPSASLAPPHSDSAIDNDGDGLYDYLDVEVKVNVTSAGRYSVNGSLMTGGNVAYDTTGIAIDGTASTMPSYPEGGDMMLSPEGGDMMSPGGYGRFIDHAWAETELQPGTQTIKLRFSGAKIRRAGVDGPYKVEISLNKVPLDPRGEWKWLDYGSHTTSTYSYTGFQSAPIKITSATDQGLDTNDNDLHDFLVINVGVDVKTAGTYLIQGEIIPEYFLAPMEASGSTTSAPPPKEIEAKHAPIMAMKRVELGAGTQTVQLRFSGGLINKSAQNGPYQIVIKIVKDFRTWEMLDEYFYTTSTAYKYTSFEEPAASFSPPHTDYGLDNNGNGKYEKLVVEAKVNVRTAGNFKVGAFLMTRWEDFVDRQVKDVTLAAGEQTITFEFDAWKIYGSHVEGKMIVGMLLLDPTIGEEVWQDMGGIKVPMSGWVDADIHTTGSYSYDQFEATAPRFSAMLMRQPVEQLRPGQSTVVNLENRNLPTIREIRITSTENTVTPLVSVTEDTRDPTYVPDTPDEIITYITITVENAQGQGFVLKISKSRLQELGINPDEVAVQRFEDNWTDVTVQMTGEDDEYYYYEVTTPGFSLFAVSGGAAPATGPGVLPTQPIGGIPPLLLVAVTAILLVVVIIAVIWRYLSIGKKEIGLAEKATRR